MPPPPEASSGARGPRSSEGAHLDATSDHTRCSELVGRALERCPNVRKLVDALAALNKTVPTECVPCPPPPPGKTAAAGGYTPHDQKVLLCENWVAQEPTEVTNTLAHELVHAYDDARAYIDWTNLVHHACTEIRAASLSGDCTFGREVNRSQVGPLSFGGAGKRCIRRRALLSVALNPMCSGTAEAESAVDRAWEICSQDTAPFEKVPW